MLIQPRAGAYASGTVFYGIEQAAFGHNGNASASLVNNGTLAIEGVASATGFSTAQAFARVANGIVQIAEVSGTGMSASDQFTNNGTLYILASAKADAAGFAYANAEVTDAIYQHAAASTGNATAGVNSRQAARSWPSQMRLARLLTQMPKRTGSSFRRQVPELARPLFRSKKQQDA